MALNINIVNSTIIEVYQDSNYPRYYFGALGTSGKFYPSGTSGAIATSYLQIIENGLNNIPDGAYPGIIVSTPSSTPISIGITTVNNIVDSNAFGISPDPGGSGYAIGDILTINGADVVSGGSGQLSFKVTNLIIDGLLIVIGGDDYEVKWYDLVVGGTSPTSLQDAQSLLASLFSTL